MVNRFPKDIFLSKDKGTRHHKPQESRANDQFHGIDVLVMAWLWAANGRATAPSTSVRPADALIA